MMGKSRGDVVRELRAKIATLEQENKDLELLLETTTQHADAVADEQEVERQDLEIMLEMATEHADAVEDDLHQRAAEAILKSERQLRMIVEATPVPVFIARLSDQSIVYANRMTCQLFGVSQELLLTSKAPRIFFEEDDYTRMLNRLETSGSVDRSEIKLVKPDGTIIWAELSLRALEFDEHESVLLAIQDITELRETNEASSRFVPRDYLKFLNRKSIRDINLGDHISGEMSIMFSDLRGFTSLSESMTPEENFVFINAYFGGVSPLVRVNQGFIIKYLGDGMQAIFPQSPENAVRAGVDMLKTVSRLNNDGSFPDARKVQIGIGVHTGPMMVGIVGERDRLQGDSYSDDVNLTARIEGLTKFYSVNLIISEATLLRLETPNAYDIRFLDKVQVVGRSSPLNLYEVFDADDEEQRDFKLQSLSQYDAALDAYYKRDFVSAQTKLFGVLQANPKDKVAWHHLMNATRLADSGAPPEWTGVTEMTAK